MYTTYFGFARAPFNDPEPGDFEPVGAQAAALDMLRASLDDHVRLLVLTGPAGTGKTSLLRLLIADQAGRRHCILFWNAHLGFDDLLNYLCDDLDLRTPGTSRAEKIKALRTALVRQIAAGGGLLLLLDDAQNLPRETLEGLHTLLDLSEVGRHPVQVVLCGQLNLVERLDETALPLAVPPRHLRLRTLSPEESRQFIERRAQAAGHAGGLFDAGALTKITELAHGVPRLLNRICNQSLLLAYLGSESVVTSALVRDVAADTQPTEAPTRGAAPAVIEPMLARPATDAVGLPPMHAPVDAPGHPSHVVHAIATPPAHEPAPVALPEVHADPVEIGHRALPPRRRTGFYLSFGIGLLAATGLTALRMGWLPPAFEAKLRSSVAALVPMLSSTRAPTSTATPAPAASPLPAPAPAPTVLPASEVHATASVSSAVPEAPRPAPSAGPAPAVAESLPPAPAAATLSPAPDDPAAGPSGMPASTAGATMPPVRAPAVEPAPGVTAAEPASGAAESGATTGHPALASAVRALLVQARNQMNGLRYTQPPGDNAVQTFREVLALAPGNEEALAGLQLIRGKFQQWATNARARGEVERAARYLDIANTLVPDEIPVAR